jgi:hypothetical protein
MAVPGLVFAQTEIGVENTGAVERPMVEGQVVIETNYVHTILWTDSGADSYDIYVSEAAITDIDAANVYKIAEGVAVGQQAYEYALQTPFAPGDVVNYYAVTASGSSAVTAGVNATTDGTAGTTDWSQPYFYFVDAPVIDANFGDWPFDPVSISPDNPDNYFGGEIDNAADFSGDIAMGTDADYIYFRAEMTDDVLVNVNESGASNIWEGDCIEWYIGLYDIRPSDELHPTQLFGNESDPAAAEPDWQLNIAGNAFDDPTRSHAYDNGVAGDLLANLGGYGLEVANIETAVGWSIEASLPYEGLVLDPSLVSVYVPKIGHINLADYVGNDGDDPAGGRQGQLFWAKDESANNSWNNPAAWQNHHTIYDPKVFGLGGGATAVEAASWGQIKAGLQ